jgi:hypothetical protein
MTEKEWLNFLDEFVIRKCEERKDIRHFVAGEDLEELAHEIHQKFEQERKEWYDFHEKAMEILADNLDKSYAQYNGGSVSPEKGKMK